MTGGAQDFVLTQKLRTLFNSAKIHTEAQGAPVYDYVRLLDINKSRHSGPQVV